MGLIEWVGAVFFGIVVLDAVFLGTVILISWMEDRKHDKHRSID